MKKRKKKQSMFEESISYLKESMIYFYIVVGLFLFSALIGFMFPENFVFFDELLKELAEKTTGLGHGELTWFIFQNNVLSSFFGLIFGVFLGIFSLMGILVNGLLLGYVYAKASAISGLGVIWMLVPHGIFELPAVFISLGLGIKFGIESVRSYFIEYGKNEKMKILGLISLILFFTVPFIFIYFHSL